MISDGVEGAMETASASWIMHPGVYIKEEMDERGWSQRDLAFILGCSEQAINPILNGKRGISPDMAKAFALAFDVPAEFFANLQQGYDLSQARIPDPSVARRREMQTVYPVREMIKRGMDRIYGCEHVGGSAIQILWGPRNSIFGTCGEKDEL